MNRLSIIFEHVNCKSKKPLQGKTVLITGASRGIGLAIGLRCAQDGANIAILAKTTTPQPTLPGMDLSIQALFIQQQKTSLRLEEKLFPWLVISETKKVSNSAFRKPSTHLEE